MASPKPLPGLLDIAPYIGGESKIAGVDRVIKLASNEGAFGPSPKAMSAIKAHVKDYFRYPDGDYTELRNALAAKHALPAENIVVGSGSDDIISLLCRSYAGDGDEILFSAHGFAMYPIYGRTVRANVVPAPEAEITIDTQAMLAAVTERTKIAFIANPNNPTGTYLPAAEVERFRDALPGHILLVVDAAYAEYVDRPDYTDGRELVAAGDNVVMLRTFSKIYGLGGMRLGWTYAPDNVVDILHRMRSPFNVSSAAAIAGIAALDDDDFVRKSHDHNLVWREWTAAELRKIGLTVPDSVCNFLLVRFPEDGPHTAEAADAFLKSRGIIVRRMGGYGLPESLRISIGLEDEMRLVVETLTEFMGRNG